VTLLAIIADDLTGAADAGGAFASAGFRTAIALSGEPDADILARSTESRGMDAHRASAASGRAARELLRSARPPNRLYKKIDSMLRGYPGEELRAVMDAVGERRALVAPALPAQGRTAVGSRQLVHGAPAGDDRADLLTLFGHDERAARPLDLATVRRGVGAVARALAELDDGILVADAETTVDLATIARAALESDIRVLAGSAGLARQLAIALPSPEGRATPAGGAGSPTLVVAASRNPATAAQVSALAAAQVPVVRPAQAIIGGAEPSIAALADELAAGLAGRGSAALTTAGLAPCAKGSAFVVELLASVVIELAGRGAIGGLVLTGGDVAAGVLAGVGATGIDLRGEVEPAIPWGVLRARLLPGVPVVTKAGSFGAPDALLRAAAHLAG
jgi:D-threonate/D-erythronate kinase